MMFILNFEYVLEEESSDSLERLNLTPPPKSDYSKSDVLHHFPTLIKLYFQLLIILYAPTTGHNVQLRFSSAQYLKDICRTYLEYIGFT